MLQQGDTARLKCMHARPGSSTWHPARPLQFLPPERVLPYGCKDNFWEMGDQGPCGPCTGARSPLPPAAALHMTPGWLGPLAQPPFMLDACLLPSLRAAWHNQAAAPNVQLLPWLALILLLPSSCHPQRSTLTASATALCRSWSTRVSGHRRGLTGA